MINEISQALGMYSTYTPTEDSRGTQLYNLLLDVVSKLGDVAVLTEGKGDVELLASIVATYNISKGNGALAEDSKHPIDLFDEIVFPQLDAYEGEGEEEILEDEESTTVST